MDGPKGVYRPQHQPWYKPRPLTCGMNIAIVILAIGAVISGGIEWKSRAKQIPWVSLLIFGALLTVAICARLVWACCPSFDSRIAAWEARQSNNKQLKNQFDAVDVKEVIDV